MKVRRFSGWVVPVMVFAMAMNAVPRLSMAAGVPIDQATADQKKAAQARYELGTKAFAANKFDAALTEFRASYDTVASPNAHLMMARSLNELGQAVRAYNELSIVESEAKVSPKYASTLDQSATLRADLAKKLAIVIVDVSGASGGKLTATVAGKEVPLGVQIAVAPGPTEVIVFSDGKSLKHDSANLAPGDIHPFKIDLTLAPAPPPPVDAEPLGASKGRSRTGFWVGAAAFGAVGVAGFIMGGVEGASAKSGYNDLEKDCHPANQKSGCAAGVAEASRQSSIQNKSTIANVGWIIGGVGAAGAATLLVVGLTRSSHDDTKTGAVPVNLRVGLSSIGLDGSF